jgi:uncharacterized paraquat-inducible protein A
LSNVLDAKPRYESRPGRSLETALALTVTALFLFVLLNATPLMSMRLQAVRKETTLAGATMEM